MKSRVEALVGKAVAASPFFSFLDLGGMDIRTVEAAKGESFSELASSNAILVCGGAFEVLSVASDLGEVLLTVLRKGDCFGVNSLFLEDPEVGTKIRCLRKGVLLLAPKKDLRSRMEASPKALARYAGLCNSKIHFLLGRIGDLAVRSSEDRLLAYLRARADGAGALVLDRPKEALAKMLNMSRAALFSAFSGLEAKGALECRGKTIKVMETKSAMMDAKEG